MKTNPFASSGTCESSRCSASPRQDGLHVSNGVDVTRPMFWPDDCQTIWQIKRKRQIDFHCSARKQLYNRRLRQPVGGWFGPNQKGGAVFRRVNGVWPNCEVGRVVEKRQTTRRDDVIARMDWRDQRGFCIAICLPSEAENAWTGIAE